MRFHTAFVKGALGKHGNRLALALMIVFAPLPGHWVWWKREFGGIYYEATSLTVYLFDAATVWFLLSAWAWKDWREIERVQEKGLVGPLVALVGLAAASVAWAFDLMLAAQMAMRFLILLAGALLIMRIRPGERFVQAALLGTLLLQTSAGLMQFWIQDDLGQRWLGEPDLNPYPGGGSVLSAGDAYWIRAYGLTPHPNILGGLLATCLLALVAPLLMSRKRRLPVWLLILLTGTAGLFVTFSRSAWLGAVVGAVFLTGAVLWHRPWRAAYGRRLGLFAVAVALLLGSLGWQHRALLLARSGSGGTLEQRSLDERAALNQAGRQLIQLAPLTGVGANNSTVALLPLVDDLPGVSPQPIHNMLLLVTAELGIGGGLLWLWLMLAPGWISLIRLRQGKLSLWALGLAAALVAFAVIDLFDYYAWVWMAGRSWRWLLWALWGAAVAPSTTTGR